MKKRLSVGIFASFILLCALTVANLVYSQWPCETHGPTFTCEHEARAYCAGMCGTYGKCQTYYWTYNYCDSGVCFEVWAIVCYSGAAYEYDCQSLAGACPK